MSDYIKREDAISQFEKICDYKKCANVRGGMWCVICAIGLMIGELRNKPAEDVVPVKHGHWRGEYDGYADGNPCYDMWFCSECDYCVEDDEYPEYNYCPSCGAKMDEVSE